MPHSYNRYGDHHTGAVKHEPDPRDYQMHRLPGVAQALATGVPDTIDLRPDIEQLYIQGSVPCCVMASIALVKSIQDKCDRRQWNLFDFLGAYHAVGGDDHEGVPTRAALDYAQKQGLQILAGTVRHRIGSYAFAPQDPLQFVEVLKAALAGHGPCIVACRLPEPFGWDLCGQETEAYHQMAIVGYLPGRFIVGNSWGPGWGQNGYGTLPFEYLTSNNFQSGDCYAYTMTDCLDPGLAPA